MSLVSLTFIFFFIGVLLVYYLVPGKVQWVVLLTASILFYVLAAKPVTLVYVVVSFVSIYCSSRQIEKLNQRIKESEEECRRNALIRAKKYSYLAGILICTGMLAALKYMNFFLGNVSLIAGIFGKSDVVSAVHWIAPLGISFYTLQMLGYLTDVYWEISKCQNNIAKLALFNCYFPQMISGPISRYREIESDLFGSHKFDGSQLYLGFLRILTGFFKKLVIAEHLLPVTDAMFADPVSYGGIYVWIGTALYVIEIYADFSGCMDIIMGVSECFGIMLPENFRTPFCSVSIQEFWQRWHITLGTWLKDYIMFPILRSGLWSRYTKGVKKHWGKRAAKLLPTFTGMLILWLGMGLWHGGGWNYIGEGIWFWLVIVSGQILEPWLKKFVQKCRIHTEGILWHNFQCIRTTFIYAVGALFFKAGSLRNALYMLKQAFSPSAFMQAADTLFPTLVEVDANIGTMRLAWMCLSVMVGVSVMVLWGCMEKKGCPFRVWLSKRKPIVGGIVVYILLFTIILLGAYGPGYSSSEFIYGGF